MNGGVNARWVAAVDGNLESLELKIKRDTTGSAAPSEHKERNSLRTNCSGVQLPHNLRLQLPHNLRVQLPHNLEFPV